LLPFYPEHYLMKILLRSSILDNNHNIINNITIIIWRDVYIIIFVICWRKIICRMFNSIFYIKYRCIELFKPYTTMYILQYCFHYYFMVSASYFHVGICIIVHTHHTPVDINWIREILGTNRKIYNITHQKHICKMRAKFNTIIYALVVDFDDKLRSEI